MAIFFRRCTAIDKAAVVFVVLGLVERGLHFAGVTVPYYGVILFAAFLSVVYLLIRVVPLVRAQMMWRLRNRLIIAYIFVALVPLLLILSMAGIAAYGLYPAAWRAHAA